MPPLHQLALGAALLLPHALVLAQASAAPQQAAASAVADKSAPLTLQAQSIRGRPDVETIAEGQVELRRGGLVMRTEQLIHDQVKGRVTARGHVEIMTAEGDRFAGSELQLTLESFEGYVLQPDYYFTRTAAGGHAVRIDFIDRQRSVLTQATYTSCTTDGGGTPAWLLSTDRVHMDFEANEGIAEGAVLRFMGVPILAAPVLSFPITNARKSGWLPPSVNLDSKSGLELALPYYWNIAPQRDATLTPVSYSRRGFGLDSELRFLEPQHRGEARWHWLPSDELTGSTRYALQWQQHSRTERVSLTPVNGALRWGHQGLRTSDDNYWKDFSRTLDSLTPRLLPLSAYVERDQSLGSLQTTLYARAQVWQVLQDTDPLALIVAPYHRIPQVGWQGQGQWPGWHGELNVDFQTEVNRFEQPSNALDIARPDGWRAHALGSVSQTWHTPGLWLTPKLAVNMAHYQTDTPMVDGRLSAARTIPTFSLDGGAIFERDAQWLGRNLLQTLEPRLHYVNTPPQVQATLPLFDTAAKDFNSVSVFSDNAFSGVDRVSDGHQVTAGVSTRLLDPVTGSEAMRLDLAQRYLLRDQLVTPDGVPLTQRFSELLLAGTAQLSPAWHLDASVQFNPEIERTTRSAVSARFTPGATRTLAASYRLLRGASEQVDVGWQWPVYRASGSDPSAGQAAAPGCRGTLYSVGRVNYSVKDSRVTDSLIGLEYDAGCWIGRIVADRLSTGRSEATTRLMLQLELVGLSRLGSNPLHVLKDNIPGYQMLREERSNPPVRDFTQ